MLVSAVLSSLRAFGLRDSIRGAPKNDDEEFMDVIANLIEAMRILAEEEDTMPAEDIDERFKQARLDDVRENEAMKDAFRPEPLTALEWIRMEQQLPIDGDDQLEHEVPQSDDDIEPQQTESSELETANLGNFSPSTEPCGECLRGAPSTFIARMQEQFHSLPQQKRREALQTILTVITPFPEIVAAS